MAAQPLVRVQGLGPPSGRRRHAQQGLHGLFRRVALAQHLQQAIGRALGIPPRSASSASSAPRHTMPRRAPHARREPCLQQREAAKTQRGQQRLRLEGHRLCQSARPTARRNAATSVSTRSRTRRRSASSRSPNPHAVASVRARCRLARRLCCASAPADRASTARPAHRGRTNPPRRPGRRSASRAGCLAIRRARRHASAPCRTGAVDRSRFHACPPGSQSPARHRARQARNPGSHRSAQPARLCVAPTGADGSRAAIRRKYGLPPRAATVPARAPRVANAQPDRSTRNRPSQSRAHRRTAPPIAVGATGCRAAGGGRAPRPVRPPPRRPPRCTTRRSASSAVRDRARHWLAATSSTPPVRRCRPSIRPRAACGGAGRPAPSAACLSNGAAPARTPAASTR